MDSALEVSVSNQQEDFHSSETALEPYVCYVCGKVFSKKINLKLHMKIHSGEKPFKCEVCSKAFQRKCNLNRHMACHEKKHLYFCEKCRNEFSCEDSLRNHTKGLQCSECDEIFCTKPELKVHIDEKHISTSEVGQDSYPNPYSNQVKHHKRRDALNMFSTATFNCCKDYDVDILGFLNSLRSSIEFELKYQLFEKKGFKWCLTLEVILNPTFQDRLSECSTLCLDSNTVPVFCEDGISECIDAAFSEIMTEFERFLEFEFFWSLKKIIKLDVLTAKYNFLKKIM